VSERFLQPAQGDQGAGSMSQSPISAELNGIAHGYPLPAGAAGCHRADSKGLRSVKLHNAVTAGFVFLCAGFLVISAAGLAQQAQARTRQGTGTAVQHGKRSFAAYCATCHGLDGRGGEHAPAIVDTPAAQVRTDEGLAGIIRHGIRGAGMPSFHFLTNEQIQVIVSYVRVLNGSTSVVNVKGDPAAGARLFFGEARCSDCHMMQGKGGFIGSDLSKFGRTHSARDIRQMILQPNKALVPRWQLVRIITHSGQHISGLIRNEDNFSIALLSEDGVFHLLMKSEIARITREPRSIMPDNYGKKLSAKQLDDLTSFLILGSIHKGPHTNSVGVAHSR
jgi:cytochrome c oxidase cbb3-type subunit III